MNDLVLAILFVLGLWWLSTGVILKMVWLRRATFGVSVGAFALLGVAGFIGAWWSSRVATPSAAYLAFACVLCIWGFHELTFLLGLVTGPRKLACPPEVRGWERFRLGTLVVIHHEVALFATLVALVAVTWGGPNQVGTQTFLVLWIMRLSAKLNVFLGVRNLAEQFVPEHLRYMVSYFRKARLNALMPFSIVGAGAVTVHLGWRVMDAEPGSFSAIGTTLVATILGLATVEHVFLALPVPDAVLWRWVIRQRVSG